MSSTKTRTLALKALSEKGRGLAVFATLNVVDSDGDLTLPGAFGEQHVTLLPAHDWGHVPLGRARIYEEGDEALAELHLNLEVAAARDWYAALKFDLANPPALQEWSYGYQPVEFAYRETAGKRVRVLSKIAVSEVSPVLRGAGVGTRTLGMKSGDPCPVCAAREAAETAAAARRLYSEYVLGGLRRVV